MINATTLRNIVYSLLLMSGSLPFAYSKALRGLPQFYQSFSKPKSYNEEMDYALIELNQKKYKIKQGESLRYFSGDQIEIKEVRLKDHKLPITEVNIVGVKNTNNLGSRDDRNRRFNSATEMTRAWSLDKKGDTYIVAVASKPVLHGVFYLKRMDPILKYVDILVNKKPHVMRVNEPFIVKATDSFKVKEVITNMKNNDDVKFRITIPKKNKLPERKNMKQFSIKFSHHKKVFASIPLFVESL